MARRHLEAMAPIHVVVMELNFSCLQDDSEDAIILVLEAVSRIDVVPHHDCLVRIVKTDGRVVVLILGVSRTACLLYVMLITYLHRL
jgi:hypothetical protein